VPKLTKLICNVQFVLKTKKGLNDMSKFNKHFFILAIAIMVVGLGFTKNAYAEWENENNEWKYLGNYGYEKEWQQINGKWYYFTSETGIMEIGWFYDEHRNDDYLVGKINTVCHGF